MKLPRVIGSNKPSGSDILFDIQLEVSSLHEPVEFLSSSTSQNMPRISFTNLNSVYVHISYLPSVSSPLAQFSSLAITPSSSSPSHVGLSPSPVLPTYPTAPPNVAGSLTFATPVTFSNANQSPTCSLPFYIGAILFCPSGGTHRLICR